MSNTTKQNKADSSDIQRNNTDDIAPTTSPVNKVNTSEKTEILPEFEDVILSSECTEKSDIFTDLTALGCSLEDVVSSEPVLASLAVRKPKKDEFVFCHDEICAPMNVYLDKDNNYTYIIHPKIIEPIKELVIRVNMVLAVNYAGSPFIWPLTIPLDRKPHPAHLSAMVAAKLARKEWVRIFWNEGEYKVLKRTKTDRKPTWPSEIQTPSDMLRFSEKSGAIEVITSIDHPVIQSLLGRD